MSSVWDDLADALATSPGPSTGTLGRPAAPTPTGAPPAGVQTPFDALADLEDAMRTHAPASLFLQSSGPVQASTAMIEGAAKARQMAPPEPDPMRALGKASTIGASPSAWQRALTNPPRALAAGLMRTNMAAWGAVRAAGDMLGLEDVAAFGERAGQDAQHYAQQIRGSQAGAGPLERAAYSGVESIGSQIGGLAAGAATGNPAVALGVMGATTGGEAYHGAREADVPPTQALVHAASQAAVEVATERMPVGKLLGDLSRRAGLVKTLTHQLASELPGEQVATVLQDLNDWATLTPERPITEYLAERPSAAVQTVVATLVGTLGQTGPIQIASRFTRRAGPPPADPSRRIRDIVLDDDEVAQAALRDAGVVREPMVAPAEDAVPVRPQAAEPATPDVLYHGVEDLGLYHPVEAAVATWQNKGTPQQLLAHLTKTKGAKAEAEDMGLAAWLADKPSVTKQEVADWVKANAVQIEETVLGDRQGIPDSEQYHEAIGTLQDAGLMVASTPGDEATPQVYYDDPDPDAQLIADIDTFDDEVRSAWDTVQRFWAASETRLIPAQYERYQLPGGEHYREILLRLPADKKQRQKAGTAAWYDALAAGMSQAERDAAAERAMSQVGFHAQHFSEYPNILAHVRVNDRTLSDGRKVLFIEEVQSDWHQKGREKGYKAGDRLIDGHDYTWWSAKADELFNRRNTGSAGDRQDAREATQREWEQARQNRDALSGHPDEVPNAPFKGNQWKKLALSRMLAYAAQRGYDAIAWTTGEQQAARYDLSKQIDSLRYYKNAKGEYVIGAHKNGERVLSLVEDAKSLPDKVGKEIAEKIIATADDTSRELSGVDLKVGGQGMVGFYDRQLPNIANDIAKQWGQKVGVGQIPGGSKWRIESDAYGGDLTVNDGNDYLRNANGHIRHFSTAKAAQMAIDALGPTPPHESVHVLATPAEMRAAIRARGLPLYQKAKDGTAQTPRPAEHLGKAHSLDAWEAWFAQSEGVKPKDVKRVAAATLAAAKAQFTDEELDRIDLVRGGTPGEGALAEGGVDTPAFTRWFKKSAVVDDQGKPKVVYHTGQFDENVDPVPVVNGQGFHFGTKQAAQERPAGKYVDDTIKSLTVEQDEENGRWYWRTDTEDSFDVVGEEGFDSEEDARENGERFAVEQGDWAAQTMEEEPPLTAAYLSIQNPMRVRDQKGDWSAAIAKAKALGHDGLVYRNEYEDKGKDSYVVFSPQQIKSVNNRGTFNPKSPNVLKQDAPANAHASVESLADVGRWIVRALTNPNASSGIHELAHIARLTLLNRSLSPEQRRGLTDADIDTVERELGVRDGKWWVHDGRPRELQPEERWARLNERYVRDGKAPSKGLAKWFRAFSGWLRDIYGPVKGSPIDLEITPELDAVLRKLYTRTERLAQAGPPAATPVAQAAKTVEAKRGPPAISMDNYDEIRDILDRDDFGRRRPLLLELFPEYVTPPNPESNDYHVSIWNELNKTPTVRARLPLMDLSTRIRRVSGEGRGPKAGPPTTKQTETEAFRRWFGASKVVDEQGKPLVVYHGSTSDIESFDPETRSKKTGNANAQLGFFFTANRAEANRYASDWGKRGGNVTPVYLAIANPYEMSYGEFDDLAMAAWRMMQSDPEYDPNKKVVGIDNPEHEKAKERHGRYEAKAREAAAKRREELIAEGYDGVVVRAGYGNEYIAFSPEQIKSAIGNRGTFDPASPNILLQEKSGPPSNVRHRAVTAARKAYAAIPEGDRTAGTLWSLAREAAVEAHPQATRDELAAHTAAIHAHLSKRSGPPKGGVR